MRLRDPFKRIFGVSFANCNIIPIPIALQQTLGQECVKDKEIAIRDPCAKKSCPKGKPAKWRVCFRYQPRISRPGIANNSTTAFSRCDAWEICGWCCVSVILLTSDVVIDIFFNVLASVVYSVPFIGVQSYNAFLISDQKKFPLGKVCNTIIFLFFHRNQMGSCSISRFHPRLIFFNLRLSFNTGYDTTSSKTYLRCYVPRRARWTNAGSVSPVKDPR